MQTLRGKGSRQNIAGSKAGVRNLLHATVQRHRTAYEDTSGMLGTALVVRMVQCGASDTLRAAS